MCDDDMALLIGFLGGVLTVLVMILLMFAIFGNPSDVLGQMICDDEYPGMNTTYEGFTTGATKQVECMLPKPQVAQASFDGGSVRLINWSSD